MPASLRCAPRGPEHDLAGLMGRARGASARGEDEPGDHRASARRRNRHREGERGGHPPRAAEAVLPESAQRGELVPAGAGAAAASIVPAHVDPLVDAHDGAVRERELQHALPAAGQQGDLSVGEVLPGPLPTRQSQPGGVQPLSAPCLGHPEQLLRIRPVDQGGRGRGRETGSVHAPILPRRHDSRSRCG